MQDRLDRRQALAGLLSASVSVGAAEADPFAELERRHGGRLGVFATDVGSGRSLAHRPDERFLMCSTFKLLLAAAVLARVDAGRESLARRLAFTRADLAGFSPVTGARLQEGSLPVEALCRAAVEVSDNTAADLLLRSLGGPAALTSWLRGLGDAVTRVDRGEPALNRPNGVLDTTTPRAMASTARTLLLGEVLQPASRNRLEGWMASATPGLARIRAGLPRGWRAGDKSGTGRDETNDVAILRPPRRPPILVAAFYEAPHLPEPAREAVLRGVGAAVARWAR